MATVTHHTKNLGLIESQKTQKIVFEIGRSLDIAKDFKGKLKIFKSCGCTSFSFNTAKTILSINYRPKKVPQHLKGKQYSTAKTVTVYNLINGKEVCDIFLFTAKVYDKV